MTTSTLHKIYDLVIAIPLILAGGWYVAADIYGLIRWHVTGKPGLVVKEGVGLVVGIPLFLCGLWLAFRPCKESDPGLLSPPFDEADHSKFSN